MRRRWGYFQVCDEKEGWDFPQTLQYLAQRAGVVLEPPSAEKQVEEEEHARLRALLEEAVIFYHHHLFQTPAGKPALEFLRRRGLTPDTIETFNLGYAPDGWDACLNFLTGQGLHPGRNAEAGVVTQRESGRRLRPLP